MRFAHLDTNYLRAVARLIAGLVSGILFTVAADAAILKGDAYITGDTIRLADVLTGSGDAAEDVAIGRAPAPGERQVLPVRNVIAVARAHGVALSNPDGISRIIVERAGKSVPLSLIEESLLAELAATGLTGPYDIHLGGQGIDLAVPHDAAVSVQVENFQYDTDTGRFQAVLVTGAGRDRQRRDKIFGRMVEMMRVPVLAQRLGRDDIIGESDIAWITVPENRVPQGTATEAGELIGKSPRRMLSADRPIRSRDVRPPVIVKKGAAVTMIARGNGLRLTALGRALEDGSKGDVIRVVNQDTHQTVETKVVGSGWVQVAFHSATIVP